MAPKTVLSRREFVKDAGGLLIGFSLADATVLPRLLAALPRMRGIPFSRPAGCVAANREGRSDSRVHWQSGNRHGRGDGLRANRGRRAGRFSGEGPLRDGRYGDDHRPRRRRRQHFDHAGRQAAAKRRGDRAILAPAARFRRASAHRSSSFRCATGSSASRATLQGASLTGIWPVLRT